MKKIAIAAAGLGAAFIALALYGSHVERQAIRHVYFQDKRIYGEVFEQGEYSSGQDAIRAYAARMRGIDVEYCPDDFRVAFLKHIHAWEAMADAQGASENLGNNIIGLFGLLQGDASAVPNSSVEFARVRESWNDLELIALSHGVKRSP